jgi:hypothetical protein
MGYCYDWNGRLACDSCGTTGEVRKQKCPFGYCPSPALCPQCKAKYADTLRQGWHKRRKCDLYALQSRLRDEERQGLIRAGKFVRCAAPKRRAR